MLANGVRTRAWFEYLLGFRASTLASICPTYLLWMSSLPSYSHSARGHSTLAHFQPLRAVTRPLSQCSVWVNKTREKKNNVTGQFIRGRLWPIWSGQMDPGSSTRLPALHQENYIRNMCLLLNYSAWSTSMLRDARLSEGSFWKKKVVDFMEMDSFL